MSQTKELSRFNSSGKTFFFNEGKAKNGTSYLAINALYGQGNQQRLVLFPPHFFQFHALLTEAIEKLTGFTGPSQDPVEIPECPSACPDCGAGCAEWRVLALPKEPMKLICRGCNEVVFTMPGEGS